MHERTHAISSTGRSSASLQSSGSPDRSLARLCSTHSAVRAAATSELDSEVARAPLPTHGPAPTHR